MTDNAPDTGTIFDSPWFALERPWFKKIAAQSDEALSLLLLLGASIIIAIALRPNHVLVKAVVLAYITLP